MLASFLPLAADAAEEGKKIIVAMLVVGLVFVGVVVLGQLGRWYGHKRAAERSRRRRVY